MKNCLGIEIGHYRVKIAYMEHGELLLGLLDDGLGLLALVGGLDQSGDGVGELSALGLPEIGRASCRERV